MKKKVLYPLFLAALAVPLCLSARTHGVSAAFIGDYNNKTDYLAYGVEVGRFVFEEGHTVVYAISDYPHIGASDVSMYYQLSKEDYETLLKKSLPDRIPDAETSKSETDACRHDFLCGESAYGKRSRFSLKDVDLSLTETEK